jgi:hypothetical protein
LSSGVVVYQVAALLSEGRVVRDASGLRVRGRLVVRREVLVPRPALGGVLVLVLLPKLVVVLLLELALVQLLELMLELGLLLLLRC